MSEALFYLAKKIKEEFFYSNSTIRYNTHPANSGSIRLGENFGATIIERLENPFIGTRIRWSLSLSAIPDRKKIQETLKRIFNVVRAIDCSPVPQGDHPALSCSHNSHLLTIRYKSTLILNTSVGKYVDIEINPKIREKKNDIESLHLFVRVYDEKNLPVKLVMNNRDAYHLRIPIPKTWNGEKPYISRTPIRIRENPGSKCFICCELFDIEQTIAKLDSQLIPCPKKRKQPEAKTNAKRRVHQYLQNHSVPYQCILNPYQILPPYQYILYNQNLTQTHHQPLHYNQSLSQSSISAATLDQHYQPQQYAQDLSQLYHPISFAYQQSHFQTHQQHVDNQNLPQLQELQQFQQHANNPDSSPLLPQETNYSALSDTTEDPLDGAFSQ